jgi:hypothetical protein
MEWNNSTKIVAVFFVALVMQSFCVFPVQADDQTTAHDRSYWNDLEIESLVEYPDGWFFTLDQMKALYEVEYNEGKRLTNFVRHNEGKYLTQCNGEPFGIPERFILTTLQHLQEMLAKGYVKYLFRLDAFHGHPFVSDQQFAEKYQNLSWLEMIKTFVHDESLRILYHSSEHLALRNPTETGPIDYEAQNLIKQRNIIGLYDGRKLEILFADPSELVGDGKSNTAIIPKGYRGVGSRVFKATKNGEFSIQKGEPNNQGRYKPLRLLLPLTEPLISPGSVSLTNHKCYCLRSAGQQALSESQSKGNRLIV